jgi:hypothetical protein
MANHDWMPVKLGDRIELMGRWKAGLANPAYITQFGWNEEECTALIALIDAAMSAHTNYITDDSTARLIVKKRTMQEATAGMRDFARSYIRFNKKMDDEHKSIFGVFKPDREPSAGGKPETMPNIINVKALGGCGVEIRFKDEATPHSWAIPEKYNGAVLRYAWGDEKITDQKLLVHGELMTRHIWRVTLPTEAVRSWLSLSACWQSGGNKGRFSEIHHIAVS